MGATIQPAIQQRIIVTVDDDAMIKSIKQAIRLMRGVSKVSVVKEKKQKPYYCSPEFYADLEAAENEIKAGQYKSVKTAEDIQALLS